MAQFVERLALDLADPLAGHVELLAHLLERPGAAVLEPEAELQDAPLSREPREPDTKGVHAQGGGFGEANA